jgi:1-acyl-sn-glycerol-3-phosphate acyltransferase
VTRRPLSHLSLRLAGWRFDGDRPSIKKYVCLAVPHTSNWDGLLLVTVARTIDLPMAWMIKDSWLRGPLGAVLRQTGAIGIDRSRSNSMVDQMVEALRDADELALVIPPEGTRKRADYWKSGFYHIARGANVPVVPGYLDYGRKRAGLGAPIDMTGDVHADMDRLRAFYAEKSPTPMRPDAFGPIRLREEA